MGNRTLIFIFIQKLLPAVFLLFVVFIFYLMRNLLLTGLAQSLSTIWPGDVYKLFDSFLQIVVFIAYIFAGLGIVLAYLQYYFFTFTLAEFDIRLQKGVLTIEKITIPYRQIQDVDVTRSIMYRIFGVSRLVIMSAGHENPEEKDADRTIFDPIDADMAEEIRLLLERRVGVQVIETEAEADAEEILAMKGKGDEYKVID